ncbi:hypothetical protein HNS38_00325 [Lentimicrobium sp. L6]|uniref:hypothetical protein n=1 Tax=Lentimicrobium sp. L6 TaxID=2735916 RepID=UPI001554D438|nr:hypothetical protein [Lentimicrobium sp. L6]NPD83181.1 hypothetical protein [Lentimicrobium sp. L6]
MKKATIILLLLISFSLFSQEDYASTNIDSTIIQSLSKKTIYFDKEWNEIPKGKHKYYRLLSISEYNYKGQKLFEVNDYYKNGKIQMNGYSTRVDTIEYIGLSTYYNHDGTIYRYSLYEYDTFKDVFPQVEKYASKIKHCDIPNKTLHIKFQPRKLKYIGYRNSDGKRIGVWHFYHKNGKYIVCDFKNGISPTVIRLYNKNDELIRKGYYNPKSH